jgi:hypothetical protein
MGVDVVDLLIKLLYSRDSIVVERLNPTLKSELLMFQGGGGLLAALPFSKNGGKSPWQKG